jgi:1,2-diacylglycerol 3-beta-galactosyltransferase
MHVEGFTSDVPRFMWLSDVVIGKPGPGAISEALVIGRPVVVLNNWRTMSHERFNAEWVEQEGVGASVRRIEEIAPALARLIDPAGAEALRARIERVRPWAVFEVPDIIDRLIGPNTIGPNTIGSDNGGASQQAHELPAS